MLHVFRAIWKKKIIMIWKPIKKMKFFCLLLPTSQVQYTFKILHFWIKFVSDLVHIGGNKLLSPPILFLAENNYWHEGLPWRFSFCYENNQLKE